VIGRRTWRGREAVPWGYQVLGRISLADGDIQTAKVHLISSSKSRGSPVLGIFGPDMSLARDLFTRGERDAVVAFVEGCSVFWAMGRERLSRWKSEIADGQTPDLRSAAAVS
jgi:hypothetical protein